jgi:catalase
MMTPDQRRALFENTARAMGDAKLPIKQRHVANCTRADPAYGAGVAKALGLEQPGSTGRGKPGLSRRSAAE